MISAYEYSSIPLSPNVSTYSRQNGHGDRLSDHLPS